MFNDQVAHVIIDAAKEAGLEPACGLAIVEVETGGKTFEQDGRTPQFLYERHIAYRESGKIGQAVRNAFMRAGLAIPHWSRSTQYKDEGTSAKRLALIARARDIDQNVANRSASWGLGQTMGFLAEEIGFADANALVAHQTGSIHGQVDCMIRELKHSGVLKALNDHNWARAAKLYNGAGYAQNQYDTRLADAYARWKRKLPQLYAQAEPASPAEPVPLPTPRPLPPEQLLAKDEIEDIQTKLRDLGFHEVGAIDGQWNTKMTGAWSAFQAHAGLPVTGHYDAASKAAFDATEIPRPVAKDRELTTADDLRDQGSDTIAHADTLNTLGKAGKIGGAVLGGAGAAEQGGLLDKAKDTISHAQDTVDTVSQVSGLWDTIHGWIKPIIADPNFLVLAIVVFFLCWVVGCMAKRIIDNRVADHRSGVHAGPED